MPENSHLLKSQMDGIYQCQNIKCIISQLIRGITTYSSFFRTTKAMFLPDLDSHNDFIYTRFVDLKNQRYLTKLINVLESAKENKLM